MCRESSELIRKLAQKIYLLWTQDIGWIVRVGNGLFLGAAVAVIAMGPQRTRESMQRGQA
jgi:hypothetical protein